MEMQQVRYFLAVTRTLNFTRAAKECNVSQPSLTHAVRLLEEELGGELFRRERPHAQLTELGQRMLPLLQQCYDSALSAKSLATSIKGGDIGSLKIAMSWTIDLTMLMPYFERLRRQFKYYELKLLRGTTSEVVEYMKNGEAELAIASTLGVTWERLEQWPLYTESFELVANNGHRLAGRSTVSLEDIQDESVLVRNYCEHAAPLADLLRRYGLNVSQGHELNSQHDLIVLLKQGFGVALAPRSETISSDLMRVSVTQLDLRRTVFLYGVAGRQRTTVATMIMKMLRAGVWSQRLN